MKIIYANDEYPLELFALQVVSAHVLRRRKRKKCRTNLIIIAVSCQLRLIESRYLASRGAFVVKPAANIL